MQSYQYDRTTTIITPFQFYLLFLRNIRSCWYSRGSRYATEIYFSRYRYQPFVFHRILMVDPWIKLRKSKDRAKKPSKKRPYSKRRLISRFVTQRTTPNSLFPIFLKVLAFLAIKLVCLWFLRLAKHMAKWLDMLSYLTQGRVPGGRGTLDIQVPEAPKGKVFSRLACS